MLWQNYKNKILIPTAFLAVFLFSYSISEARQGCCSRHGGVCGCGCCDGSGLSATCAPYYPECNSAPARPIVQPPAPAPVTAKPYGATTNTAPTAPITPTAPSNQNTDDGGSAAGMVATLAAIGGGVWYFNKRNKKA
jgi:hypothetical protein